MSLPDLTQYVSIYTRHQALADGVLVELDQKLAQEAGIKLPVACTAALWNVVNPSEKLKKLGQSVKGRSWDLFFMFYLAVRSRPNTDSLLYRCLFLQEGKRKATEFIIKAVLGPDDDGDPCITFMLSHED
jgi:hypothetical protein